MLLMDYMNMRWWKLQMGLTQVIISEQLLSKRDMKDVDGHNELLFGEKDLSY